MANNRTTAAREAAPATTTADASAHAFRLMVESVVDYAMLMLDTKGIIMTWNAGAERIKGYRAEEIIGRHFSQFYSTEDVERGKPARELEVAAAEGRFEDEDWRVRKDGSRFWANVVITALRDRSGALRGFGKVTRDLTQRKQAEDETRRLAQDLKRRTEELTAANAELEAFTYSVAHDLRAPLRQVSGFAKVLLEDHAARLDAEGRRCLEHVDFGARSMGDLIDDLLHLSRIGRQPLSRDTVALGALAQSAREELAADCAGRNVEWRIGELFSVRCDRALIKQVFVNLLSNAVKYSRPRERAVIEVGSADAGGERAVFVRDNGVGFDMRYAAKLFGVFERLHKAKDFEGTGVGLAIVSRIVHKHGGRVWAEAQPDAGATFYFTVPSGAP